MDYVKVFYSGNNCKVYKLLSNVNNSVNDVTGILQLMAKSLDIESRFLFGTISEINKEIYFYTEQHELELKNTDDFILVFDSNILQTTQEMEGTQ